MFSLTGRKPIYSILHRVESNAPLQLKGFHCSSQNQGRFPALKTRISRQANQRNIQHILKLKENLGKRYKLIGRDKRTSPISERFSPSKPTQPEPPLRWKREIGKFLVSISAPRPSAFVTGFPGVTPKMMEAQQDNRARAPTLSKEAAMSKGSLSSLLMPSLDAFRKTVITTNENTVLELPINALPAIEKNGEFEFKTKSEPYYQFSLAPSETAFLLKDTPSVIKKNYEVSADITGQQAEMMRRILSINSANAKGMKVWNTARAIEIFQTHASDTGSSQVQGNRYKFNIIAAVMDIKIQAMKQHLFNHLKDKSTKRRYEICLSKQNKVLKYLRRKVIHLY